MRTTRSVMVRHLLTLASALAVLTTNANAQLVIDGQTNIWSGVATNVRSLTVGSSASFALLEITEGSLVNSEGADVGYGWYSDYNSLSVSGTNSFWTNIDFSIGWGGSFNQLIISNGASVVDSYSIVGAYGSDNSVIVTGPNSRWISNVVSNGSAGNHFTVANGGLVSTGFTYIGGGGNFISVSGAGSLWTGFGGFGGYPQIPNDSSSFNLMVISNGGKVSFATSGSIGPVGDHNTVIVTGGGSRLDASKLQIGRSGFPWGGPAGNQLLISNGGVVFSSINLIITGSAGGASDNLLRNDGGFITVINGASTGVLDVRNGILLLNGGTNSVDRLLLTNGVLSLLQFNAGTLRTRRLTNDNGSAFVVGDGTNAAKLIVEGTNVHGFTRGILIQTNATLTGTGTINGSVTNCGTIFLTNADQMIFTGPVVNKGVIIAVTGTPRFGSTFTNLGTLITTASINVANVSVSGPDIVLQFNSVSNYLHEVQASTNVSSGLWQSLTTGLLGTGSPITFTDPGGALSPNRTYRVLLH